MKKYSDEITAERGLSVIRNAKGKGASHYEWEMVQGNQSWKQKLKNIIDNTLKNSESFEDYLVKIKAQDIEIKYKDYVKKSGKCLGFKMPGQKYFIYAEKLGWYYEEAQLRTRIDRVNQRKTESLSRKTTRKMFETDNRIKGLFELSEDRFNSYGMHRWGTIENLKQGFKTLARRSNEFKPEPKPERPTLHMPKEKDYNTNTIAGLKKYVNDCIVYKAAIYEIPKERVYFKDDINEWNYSWDVPAIYISDMDYYYNQQGYYPFCYDSKASKAAKSAMFRVESFCNELISIDEKPKNAELTIKWKHLGHNNYEIYVMCS